MADGIKLSVVTADGGSFEKMVNYISLPTAFGSVGVLSGHAPMLCAVKRGSIKFRTGDSGTYSLPVSDGIANVADNEVTVLVSNMGELTGT